MPRGSVDGFRNEFEDKVEIDFIFLRLEKHIKTVNYWNPFDCQTQMVIVARSRDLAPQKGRIDNTPFHRWNKRKHVD